jgi:hypothetical protein
MSILARTGALALAGALIIAFAPIDALEPFQTMAVKEALDNLVASEQITHIE